MRLSWFSQPKLGRRRAARSRRRAASAPLRVRQLERRRVLDAAVASLMVNPVAPPEVQAVPAAATAASEESLTFDWSAATIASEAAAGAEIVGAVGISNVPPVLVVASDQTIGEGQLLDLSGVGAPPLGLFVDPDLLDTHTATIDWGDGTPSENATIFFGVGAGALGGTHIYAEDGTYTVTVNVMDGNGGGDTETFEALVNNVPPVLVVALDQTVDEGQLLDLSGSGAPPLGLFIDSGKIDTHTATVNWGDGSATENATIFFADGSGALGGAHTFIDNGTYSVTVNVMDDDGGSDTETFTVTVNNVAPTATLANNGPVDEGSAADVSFGGQFDPSIADTMAGFRYAYDFDNDGTFDVGDGTYAGSTASDSQMVPASFLNEGPGTYTVKARILDKDGGFSDYTTNIDVLNVAPQLIDVVGATIGENGVATIAATIVDDGTQDVFSIDVDWLDGTMATISGLGLADAAGSVGNTSFVWTAASRRLELSHQYLDDGPSPGNGTASDTYPVSLTVRDDDLGTSGPYTADVTVHNVPPVLVVALDQMANEGQLLDLSGSGAPPLGLFIDTGKFDTHVATIDWGDGTAPENATIFFADGSGALGGTHTYADDGVYPVTVTVDDDDDGSSATQSFFVTVNNVRPVLVVAVDQTVKEGQLLDLSGLGAPPLGLFVDDGKLDTHTATIDWGDGSTMVNATVFQGSGSGALGGTHTYADDGVYPVTVTVVDDDGGSDTKSFFVTVNNVRPVLVVAVDQTVNEGQLLDLSGLGAPPLGLFVDDGKLDTHTATIDWGDGSAMVNATVFQGSGSGALGGTHTYADDGVYTVTVTVVDDDGGSHTQSLFVAVNNVNPLLTEVTPSATTIDEGQSVSFDVLFSDPGFDNELNPNAPVPPTIIDPLHESFTYDIDWGDGRDAIVGIAVADTNGSSGVDSSGTIAGSHTYADDGVYTVTVTVVDDNGGSHTQQFTVTVENVAPAVTDIVSLAVNEGSAFSLIGLGVHLADPGFDNPLNPIVGGELQETFAIHSIHWGDGTPPDTSSVSIANRESGEPGVPTTAQFGHAAYTYADDGDYTVTIRVADDDMGAFANLAKFVTGVAGVDFVDLAFVIHVNNVAPTLTSVVPSPTTINESESVSFEALFSDPGFDNELNPNAPVPPTIIDPLHESFTYDIDWGDGRQEVASVAVADTNGLAGTPSTGSFGASHVYADDGVYTVTVTIHDDNGGSHFQTFQVTVQNVNPAFVPAPGGASFTGDDVSAEGITTIRVSFDDPGFDNTANPNPSAPPSITDTLHESFTHLLDWGDGTMDAVHTYVDSGVYTVTVTASGPGGSQMLSFAGFDSSLQPVLTLVSSQTLNNPAVMAEAFTYVVDWGDGAVQTFQLMLREPGNPLFNNGRTTVLASRRTSGSESVLTDGSFEVRHRYTGPPDPTNPAADIRITATIVDDNNSSVSDFILVSNPGVKTINAAIDTTPNVPRLEFIPPLPMQVFIDQPSSSVQSLESPDARVASGELAVTSDRYLELKVVSPDGSESAGYRIRDEALQDLRAFFATLPDARYKIFLVRTENNSRRLIMDVYVRHGRVIDPSDDSEGTRDRPPTSEGSQEITVSPPDENPFLEEVPNQAPPGAPNQPDASPAIDPQGSQGDDGATDPSTGDPQPEAGSAGDEPISTQPTLHILPLGRSLRWMVPLVGLGLAAAGGRWSERVDAALQQADDKSWQRLRQAGRLGRITRPTDRAAGRRILPRGEYNRT